jgi:Regulator of chromosome condensation (RCC1) repeat
VTQRVLTWRRAFAALIGLVLLASSCSDTTNVTAIPHAKGCQSEADCDEGLTCTKREGALGGLCHVDCESSESCALGQRCVHAETATVCQLAEEVGCLFDSDCFVPLKCGPDQKCRNECKQDYDCVKPQKCTNEHYCGEPYEVNAANELIVQRGPGTAEGGSGGLSAGGAGAAAGTGMSEPERGGASGLAGAAGDVADAGDGGAAGQSPIAQTPCSADLDCQAAGLLCGIGSARLCGGCQHDTECTASSVYGTGTLCSDGQCVTGSCHPNGNDCPVGQTCDGVAHACRLLFSRIAVSEYQTCGIASSGTVWCWGRGPLGDGSLLSSKRPVLVHAAAGPGALVNAIQVATSGGIASSGNMGEPRTCVLKQDKTVWCWGTRNVGDGTSATRALPTQVNAVNGSDKLGGVSDVALADLSACALLSDGYPRCWGESYLGDGSGSGSVNPVVVNLSGTTALAASAVTMCALAADKTTWCWAGSDNSSWGGVPTQIKFANGAPLSDLVEVRAGRTHNCARKSDRSVWCWGNNSVGQLGDGTTTKSDAPVRVHGVGGNGWLEAVSISAGTDHSCAILPGDNELACWGRNESGQLGIGITTNQPLAVKIPAFDDAKAIAASAGYTCALKIDGSAWCWGGGYFQGLNSGTPVPVLP